MDVFNQYDVFREKCFGFEAKFKEIAFKESAYICHPTCENEIISVCSDEEAKTNGLNICRLSDMLLMSADNETWETFNLIEARKIAAENGFVYLTDLLGEDSFYAEDWMINGQNDQIIVSEEYMREKGKRYAPVTPLTNKVLHFKKMACPFFWTPSEPGAILPVNKETMKKRLDDYAAEALNVVPPLNGEDNIEFQLFDEKVEINTITTRALKTDVFFAQLDNMLDELSGFSEILEINRYDFSRSDFITDVAVSALNNNGISINKDTFCNKYYYPLLDKSDEELAGVIELTENKPIDCIKIAFVNAVKAEAAFDYVYPVSDSSEYYKSMHDLEQSDFSGITGEGAEKHKIAYILGHKPADFSIFAYIAKRFPEETVNAARIAEFWGISPVDEGELQRYIFSLYLNNGLYDENGNFASGLDQALIIRDELIKVNTKYGFTNTAYLDELNEYIKDIDLKRRSYNGTVFDTPEDMKRAMANELELQALCIDLSALDESELIDLQKHINGITIDEATKAKYLVKVKIALNRCEESMLEQLCLGLPMLSADEAMKLRENVADSGYAESVVRPKLADINDRIGAALTEELEKLTAKEEKMTDDEIISASEQINSGRYPAVLAEFYLRKIDSIAEKRIIADIESICNGMESFNMDELKDAKSKLVNSGYPEEYTAGVIGQINTLMENYEKNEIAKLFENIDFATADELDSIKNSIEENNYTPALLEPYISKIAEREQALLDEELTDMCADIDDMAQEELDKLREAVNDQDKKYSDNLREKYLEKITHRECELKNSELAEKCKYIFSMEQDELDELKEILLSDKYDEEITTVYLKKVTEREDELRAAELDKLCENIDKMDADALNKLRDDILGNDDYTAISESYIERIDVCLENLKYAEFNKMLETVNDMDSEALAEFRAKMESEHEELGDELFEKSMAKAAERENAIEIEKLDAIVADIDSFDIASTLAAINEIRAGSYKPENKEEYISRLDEKAEELYLAALDALVENIEACDKAGLLELKKSINNYDCPAEYKTEYIHKVEKHITDLAEKEVREICGDINSLSIKKCHDAMIKIRALSLSEDIKNQYLDSIEAHIMSLREAEQRDFIDYLKKKIKELNVSTVNFLVPSISNLFYPKYDEACKKYASIGRYELPIFLHENTADCGFTLTTEYFYTINKGILNRIKIDDLVSFQSKKGLVGTSIVATDRNGNTTEIPCSINKNSIDTTAKAMTALVCYIRDKRSAEHMKELLENAANERKDIPAYTAPTPMPEQPAAPAAAPEAAPAPVVEKAEETPAPEEAAPAENAAAPEKEEAPAEEVKPKFCDQCGAKIVNHSAKFCMECGNKLF